MIEGPEGDAGGDSSRLTAVLAVLALNFSAWHVAKLLSPSSINGALLFAATVSQRRDSLHQAFGEAFLRFLASAITVPSQHNDSDTAVLSEFCHPWKHEICHVGGVHCMGTWRKSVHRTGLRVRKEEGTGPRLQLGCAVPGSWLAHMECHRSIRVASVLWQPACAGIPGKAQDGKIITWRDNHLN